MNSNVDLSCSSHPFYGSGNRSRTCPAHIHTWTCVKTIRFLQESPELRWSFTEPTTKCSLSRKSNQWDMNISVNTHNKAPWCYSGTLDTDNNAFPAIREHAQNFWKERFPNFMGTSAKRSCLNFDHHGTEYGSFCKYHCSTMVLWARSTKCVKLLVIRMWFHEDLMLKTHNRRDANATRRSHHQPIHCRVASLIRSSSVLTVRTPPGSGTVGYGRAASVRTPDPSRIVPEAPVPGITDDSGDEEDSRCW